MFYIISAEVEYFASYSYDILLRRTSTIPWSKLKSANQQENPEKDIKDETVKFLRFNKHTAAWPLTKPE